MTKQGGIRKNKYPNLSLLPSFHLLMMLTIDQNQSEARRQGGEVMQPIELSSRAETSSGVGNTQHTCVPALPLSAPFSAATSSSPFSAPPAFTLLG